VKGKEAEKEREKEKDKDKESEKQLPHGARSLSLDTTVSDAESDVSNSCYSDNENSWVSDFKCRQMPNAMYVLHFFSFIRPDDGESRRKRNHFLLT
jgi:hypothetical protein